MNFIRLCTSRSFSSDRSTMAVKRNPQFLKWKSISKRMIYQVHSIQYPSNSSRVLPSFSNPVFEAGTWGHKPQACIGVLTEAIRSSLGRGSLEPFQAFWIPSLCLRKLNQAVKMQPHVRWEKQSLRLPLGGPWHHVF